MNTTSESLELKDSSFEESFFNKSGTYVHPTAVVGSKVKLDEGVKIGPFCSIVGDVTILANTRIFSTVSIGFPAQNIGTIQSLGTIQIGKNCDIREGVTIGASKYPDGKTSIGDNCYIMSYSHIAHDVILENNVTLINSVNLGGHVHVEKNAFLMANCASHQFCRIGQFTALAPYSAIRQDLPPFCMFSGLPAKFYGVHITALKRAGFNSESINNLKHVTKLYYQDKLLISDIKKLAQIETNWGLDSNVQSFISFIENSKRGVAKKTALDF